MKYHLPIFRLGHTAMLLLEQGVLGTEEVVHSLQKNKDQFKHLIILNIQKVYIPNYMDTKMSSQLTYGF